MKPLTSKSRLLNNRYLLLPGLLVAIVLLLLLLLGSIMLGAADINPSGVINALLHFDSSQTNHVIIQTVRFPRVLIGAFVGAALAVAGAIMQGLTRNPLADAGILGIGSGASLAVVIVITLMGTPPTSIFALAAFLGAGISATVVYAFASMGRGGATPLKLTLAGVSFSALTTSFTTALLIRNRQALDQIRLWTVGSLAGREMPLLLQIGPYLIVGLIGAMVISRQITTISLGEDVAKGLGQNTVWIRTLSAILVMLLAGSAVALAGAIGFVGLIVPHVVRAIVGVDYRWVIPYSAVLGAILITITDVGARMVLRPQELPVGVVMAVVGTPFFIWLTRWRVNR